MSLRWRWALTLGGATAAIALLVLVASTVLTARELRAGVDQDLEQRLELAREEEFLAPVFQNPGRPGRRAPVNLDALYRVFDPTGLVVVESIRPELPIPESAAEFASGSLVGHSFDTVIIDDEAFRTVIGGLGSDRRGPPINGAVQIAVSIERTNSSIAAAAGRATAIGGLLIVAAAAAGWVLAGRSVGPIERLTAEAERIAETEDLTINVEAERSDEIGRLADSFSTMIGSLRRSREQQQRLVADAGHEFRTPLTALRTNLETLERRRDELTNTQVDELLSAAIAESIELADLATELVDLSHDASATGEGLIDRDLKEIAESVVSRYGSRTSNPIVVSGNGSNVSVRVNQMERAISNLLSNAIAWNPAEHPITVTVDGSMLTVRDHGPGIPDDDLPHVFERFYRSDEARTNPGSGLGLSIVAHVVEGHGGEVFARNAADGGAEVGFALEE